MSEILILEERAAIAVAPEGKRVRVALPVALPASRAVATYDGTAYRSSLVSASGGLPLPAWVAAALMQAVAIAADRESALAWAGYLEERTVANERRVLAAVARFRARVVQERGGDGHLLDSDSGLVPYEYQDVAAVYDRIALLGELEQEVEQVPVNTAAVSASVSDFVAEQVAIAVADLEDGIHVLFVGPTGSGKNTAAEAVFAALGCHVEIVEGKENLDDLYVCGSIVPQEGGALRWVDGPLARAFRRAAKERVLLWWNEINRCQRKHLNVLISALDPKPAALFQTLGELATSPSSRYYSLEIPQTGERLLCPVEHLMLLAAGNLGSQYAVSELDPALERRFGTVVEFDYLEPEAEARLLLSIVPSLSPRLVQALAVVAKQIRLGWRNAEYAAPLDTGRLVVWARKLARYPVPTLGSVLATARTTWLAVVAGRDHRGLVDEGVAEGLLDLVKDLVGGAL